MSKATVSAANIFHILKLIKTPSYKLKINGEIRTDPALVDEVLSSIPPTVWKNSKLILDPCCGRGTILLKMIDKLLEHHSAEKVSTMIYALDVDSHCVYTTKELVAKRLNVTVESLVNNIIQHDCLTWDPYMKKFDVIVGNPPYQNPGKSKGQKLWYKFIFKCHRLLKDKGHMAMVTPSSWIRGGVNHGRQGVLKDIFAKEQLHIASFDNITKRYFGKIGIDISWWMMEKTPIHKQTQMVLKDTTVHMDLKDVEVLSPVADSNAISILGKFIDGKLPKEEVIYYNYKNSDRSIESGTPTATHTVKHWVHGCSQKSNDTYAYLEKRFNDKLNFNKILFLIGSRYWQPHVDENAVGVIAQGFAIKIKDEWTKANILSVYESKLWKLVFFNFQLEQNGFMKNAIVKKTPAMDMSKPWTDAEIYKYFNLTQEEIDYIESTIK